MALEQTWRWFGPNDPISLAEIKQTGATGIVTALHHIPVGEVWSTDEIMKRKAIITAAGFSWSVVESIPVHDDIKRRTGRYQTYIDNYKQSLRNLGGCGIDMVCYNFMPVLDWSRTDLRVLYRDGSITTRFETHALTAFDLFILKRAHAEHDYTPARVAKARKYFDSLSSQQQQRLTDTILLGLPGSLEAHTLEQFRSAIALYNEIDQESFRENLLAFIREIAPVAEEAHVFLALHPDDPPWSLFGLPRVVGTAGDIRSILQGYDSTTNGITLCTGSLGARFENDLVEMASEFAGRTSFVHLRNVSRNKEGDFEEVDHLEGDVDMAAVMKAILLEQKRRVDEGRKDIRLPFRPDHGRLMIPDSQRQGIYPGYSLVGRMRGLAELRGLELGLRRMLGL